MKIAASSLFTFFAGVSAASYDWRVKGGGLTYKNQPFHLKGASWFGLETCTFSPHGMDHHSMDFYLDFLAENRFNIIRVPISQQWLLMPDDTKPEPWAVSADPSLQGKTSWDILDAFVDMAYDRGIFTLLDIHRLPCSAQSHEVWYSLQDKAYTTTTFFHGIDKLLARYQDHPGFHGIDLLNEPRGVAAWGDDLRFSWNHFVEAAFSRLDYYDGLIYVEGIGWGRDFSNMKEHPIRAPEDRIVFSPHMYGPSVSPVGSMDVASLHADWTNVWGYLVPEGKTVVIGEFGGRYDGADRQWQNMFVEYLVDLNVSGVYWCMNPDSSDTGGLLADDWTTPMADKLALLERLQPHPTVV